MSELEITKIDDSHLLMRGAPWVTDEGWQLIRRLKPGELLELTSLQRGEIKTSLASLRASLKARGLARIRPVTREKRLFAIYWPEQRDGTA